MGELIFMLIVAVTAIALFINTYSFPVSIIDQSGGAGLFPRIVIILLLFFMTVRTVRWFINPETRRKFVFVEMFQGTRLIYLIGTVLYIAILPFLGYVLSTILFMGTMVNYFYSVQWNKRPSVGTESIIMIGILIGTIGLYFFFGEILNIRLPQGILTII